MDNLFFPLDGTQFAGSVSGRGLSGPQSGDSLTDLGCPHISLTVGHGSVLMSEDFTDLCKRLSGFRTEIIGDCLLINGDCLDIFPLLGPAETIVSDPPFGMCFVSSRRKLETKHIPIQNDQDAEMLRWITAIPASHSKYIFCRWDNLKDVPPPKSAITWIKNNHSMGDLEHEHARQTELILFYNGDKHFFPKGRPNDVIKADRTGNGHHPTEKPVSLMEVLVSYTSGTVIDPFMGSGSTGVACAKSSRKFIGIEIESKYFDIACSRVKEAYQQPDLFIEPPKKRVEQETMI